MKLSPPWIWERGEVVVPYNLVKKGVQGWCRLWRRHPCLGNEVATREEEGGKGGGELVKEICVCDRRLLFLLLLLLSGPGAEGPRHTHDGWRLVSRKNGGNRRHRGDIKSFLSIFPLGKHFGNSDELCCQSKERKWSSQGLFKQTEAESILMNLLCPLSN